MHWFSACGLPETIRKQMFMICSSSKVTVMKCNENRFMVGVTITLGTVLKGPRVRKAETHCSNFINEEALAEKDGVWKRSGP